MTDPNQTIAKAALDRLKWPLRLTRAGMVAESITRGFWSVWTILFALMAAFAFGAQDYLPLEALWIGGVLSIIALLLTLWSGIRDFHWPTVPEALARIDARLPGRPISALTDGQALGTTDAASTAVWRVHLSRMAERAATARAVQPDLRVARRDPFALRYVAVTALVMALIFGSLWRVAEVGSLAGGKLLTVADGPSWEGWVEPPAYTGKPALYLSDITAAGLSVPEGSRITIRLYGAPDGMSVSETVSDPVLKAKVEAEAKAKAADSTAAETATTTAAPATVNALQFEAVRSGTLSITGIGGRDWQLTILPDAPPSIAATGKMGHQADGTMTQAYTASDDYGVTGGTVTFALDTAKIDRRFGLTIDAEKRDVLTFDLPLPITGNRAQITGSLAEYASKHPFANLPVLMTLTATDARGQTGQTMPTPVILPGRRFFDPLASAIIEMRRDLLWNRDNAARVAQIIHAITNRPEDIIKNQRAYLMLRVATRRLDAGIAQGDLAPAIRDEIADAFWDIAVLLEDGGVSDALARMQQAQERLSEAIRNGASPEEVQKLMDDLKEATDNYIAKLAENMDRKGADEPNKQADNQGQQITGDQIQQMMDQIQKLMNEGRMAEAQELLDQLSRMMENLRVTEGQDGQGTQVPGGKAMKNLQDTLKGQQGLSDDSFRQLQDQFDPGIPSGRDARPGQSRTPPNAQGQGQAQGQDGQQNPDGTDGQSLAQRQKALRDMLSRQQQGQLPGAGTPEGEAARKSLDDAARAMDQAEKSLRDGDLSGAIDQQAQAIENLREGIRNMGQALARNNTQTQPSGNQGEAFGDAGREVPRDPLGRATGQNGQMGTDKNMLQGQDVYRRARDLLDEIRKRSAEQGRPAMERDYLRRLLNQF